MNANIEVIYRVSHLRGCLSLFHLDAGTFSQL